MPERTFVFDTFSLGNFLLSESNSLLVRRYKGRLRVTPQVLDELAAGMRARPALGEVSDLVARRAIVVVDLGPAERAQYAALIADLGRGEASCIALGGSRGWTVITDDRAARNHCAQSKLTCTGTIGILKAACIDRQIEPSDADRILSRMVAAGFYSPVGRVSSLLR